MLYVLAVLLIGGADLEGLTLLVSVVYGANGWALWMAMVGVVYFFVIGGWTHTGKSSAPSTHKPTSAPPTGQ